MRKRIREESSCFERNGGNEIKEEEYDEAWRKPVYRKRTRMVNYLFPNSIMQIIFCYADFPTTLVYALFKNVELSEQCVNQLLLQSMERDVENALKNDFGEMFQEFRELLANSGACVAGSYNPQAIISGGVAGGVDQKSDIDIWVPITTSDLEAYALLDQDQEKSHRKQYGQIMQWFQNRFDFVSRKGERESKYFSSTFSEFGAIRTFDLSRLPQTKSVAKIEDQVLRESTYWKCLHLAREKALLEDLSDTKNFMLKSLGTANEWRDAQLPPTPWLATGARGATVAGNGAKNLPERKVQVIHVIVPNGSIINRRKSMVEWIGQNFDIDICKFSWVPVNDHGEGSAGNTGSTGSIQVASTYPTRSWFFQSALPWHTSVYEATENLLQRRANWRLSKKSIRGFKRCDKYLGRGWNLLMPGTQELLLSVLADLVITREEYCIPITFYVSRPRDFDTFDSYNAYLKRLTENLCVDKDCPWKKFCGLLHACGSNAGGSACGGKSCWVETCTALPGNEYLDSEEFLNFMATSLAHNLSNNGIKELNHRALRLIWNALEEKFYCLLSQ